MKQIGKEGTEKGNGPLQRKLEKSKYIFQVIYF